MSRAKRGNKQRPVTRLGDLVTLLDQLRALYEEMLALIGRKIEAMRKADLDAMRVCQQSEHELTKRVNEREGLRRQLMDAIGVELGLASGVGRALSISQFTEKLGKSERAGVISAADGLKSTIAKVAQSNRIAGVISREIVHHLRWVFAAVQPREQQPAGYSGAGVVVPCAGARLFETVG